MTYHDAVADLTPLHYWILEGDLLDIGDGIQTSLLASSVTTSGPPLHPTATGSSEFTRSSDRLYSNSVSDLNGISVTARSVSMVLHPTLDTLPQALVTIGTTTAGMQCFMAGGMVPALSVTNGSTTETVFADYPLTVNQTAQLVFVFDAGTLRIYVDGRPVAESSAGPASIPASATGLQIGNAGVSTSGAVPTPGGDFTIYTLEGFVSDVAVWNSALTESQIYDDLFGQQALDITAQLTFTDVPDLTEVRVFDIDNSLVELGSGIEVAQGVTTVTVDYNVATTVNARITLVNATTFEIFQADVVLTRRGGTFQADLLLQGDRNYYEHGWQQEFPPEITVPPVVSGTLELGSVLSCTAGTWFGTLPFSITYQWRRDGLDISGATSSTYTLIAADQQTTLSCVVTNTNPIGSDSSTSNIVGFFASGQVGHFRHTTGFTVTTTATAITFDQADRNDNSLFAQTGADIRPPSGTYLVMYQMAWLASNQTSRGNLVAYLTKNGSDIAGSFSSGFQRDTANDAVWATGAAIVQCSGTDDLAVEVFRGSGSSVGAFHADKSWFSIVKLSDDSALGLYTCGSDNVGFGATTYSEVALASTQLETDATSISRSGNDITLQANRNYLVVGGCYFDATSSRTTRFSRLTLGGTHIDGSTGYAYLRDTSNPYGSPHSMAMVRPSATTTLNLQARGPGPGGTPSAGASSLVAARSGLMIVELPSSALWFHGQDAVGGHNIQATSVAMTPAQTVVRAEPSLVSVASTSSLTMAKDADVLALGGMMIRRTSSSGTRNTREAHWNVNNVAQNSAASGEYNRGDQGSQDCYDSALTPRGIISATTGQSITLTVSKDADAGWNDGGGTPQTDGSEPFGAYLIDLSTV